MIFGSNQSWNFCIWPIIWQRISLPTRVWVFTSGSWETILYQNLSFRLWQTLWNRFLTSLNFPSWQTIQKRILTRAWIFHLSLTFRKLISLPEVKFPPLAVLPEAEGPGREPGLYVPPPRYPLVGGETELVHPLLCPLPAPVIDLLIDWLIDWLVKLKNSKQWVTGKQRETKGYNDKKKVRGDFWEKWTTWENLKEN